MIDPLPLPAAYNSTSVDLKLDQLVLAWTSECVNTPIDSRLAARIEGKSSLALLGLGIHVTAPTIHAGSTDNPT